MHFLISLILLLVATAGCLGQSGPAGAPGGGSAGGILNPGNINPGGMNPGGSVADPLAASGGGVVDIGGGAGATQDGVSVEESPSETPPERPSSTDVPEPVLCVRGVNCPRDRRENPDVEGNDQREGDQEAGDDGRGSLAEVLEEEREEMEERQAAREEAQREWGENLRESGVLEMQQPAEPEEAPLLPLMNADAGQLPDSMNQMGQAALPQNAAFPYPNAVQQPAAPASQEMAAPAQRVLAPASPLPSQKLPKNINSLQLTPSGT